MMHKSLRTAAALAAMGLYGLLAVPTYAATTSCSAFQNANGIIGDAGCEVGSQKQDTGNAAAREAVVNGDQFFGHTDWKFQGEIPGVSGQSGSWSISASLWNSFANLMIVLSDGDDTFMTGYLLVTDIISGNYTSPFQNPNPNGDPKNISHASLYGQGTPPNPGPGPVPLPGAVYLFGTALAGLGLLGRRRRLA